MLSHLPDSAGFLLGLLLDSEDGGDMLLRNIRLAPDYAVLTQKTIFSIVPAVRTSHPTKPSDST